MGCRASWGKFGATCLALGVMSFALGIGANSVRADGAESSGCSIVAAGDIAGPNGAYKETAALATSLSPTRVIMTGDAAQVAGAASEYADLYDPTWGALKDITLPAPGNHDYATAKGAAYYNYFGVEKYYSATVCGWLVISLNSLEPLAPQVDFAKSAAKANPDKPILLFWHFPRYSSGSTHGDVASMQPLWQAAADIGAKLVFSGHDHHYERFAPMNASGVATADGVREFVVGTGGFNMRSLGDPSRNSEKTITKKPGVLKVVLGAQSYSWAFYDTTKAVLDSGTTAFGGGVGPTSTSPSTLATPSTVGVTTTTASTAMRSSTTASTASQTTVAPSTTSQSATSPTTEQETDMTVVATARLSIPPRSTAAPIATTSAGRSVDATTTTFPAWLQGRSAERVLGESTPNAISSSPSPSDGLAFTGFESKTLSLAGIALITIGVISLLIRRFISAEIR